MYSIQMRFKIMVRKFAFILLLSLLLSVHTNRILHAQSLDLSVKGYGLSFGNSKNFNGVRLNFRDRQVEEINGINVTLWRAKKNEQAIIRGLSLGLVPEAGDLLGIHLGLGVAATNRLKWVSFGLLGAGAGKRASGVIVGGLGAGAGESMKGIALAGFGAGAGRELTGIAIAGLGAGAGENMKGIAIAGLGAGAGRELTGIAIAGLGAGAGENMKGVAIAGLSAGAGRNATGVMIGGLAAGAGENLTGFAFGLLAAGCGRNLTGVSIGGLGAGCGNVLKGIAVGGGAVIAPEIHGWTIAGFRTRSERIRGVTLTLGWVKVEENFVGFTASAFNQIKGKQTGVSLGIVNYAHELNGLQIGLINYVRDNPRYRKVLPLINANF